VKKRLREEETRRLREEKRRQRDLRDWVKERVIFTFWPGDVKGQESSGPERCFAPFRS
jgi:hypothetical protein